MTRRSVDFPLPLGPSRAVSEPSGTSIDTSSSAVKLPKRFVTDCATIAISRDPSGDIGELPGCEKQAREGRRERPGSLAWARLRTLPGAVLSRAGSRDILPGGSP